MLTPVKEVVVVVKPNSSLDATAAALAQALRRIGRWASVVCPTKITGYKELQGIGEVLTDLPQKQLSITVSYQNGSFVRGETQRTSKSLQINLFPSFGQSAIEPLNIDYKNYESRPEVIISIKVENLAHLQEFYQKNQTLFNQLPIINIDYHLNNARYGKVNLIDPKASSVSEMVTLMLYDLRVAMDEQIADNLYQGLASQTQNFAPAYQSANLLEAASICLRYKKVSQRPATVSPTETSSANQPTPQSSPSFWSQATSDWK